MVSVAEAFRIVQACSLNLQFEEVTVLQAMGRVLAEPLVADRDFPPFFRVAMDGIAIDVDRFKGVGQEFKIEATQAAGSHQLGLLNPMNCIEVMTGAMLPQETNVVIRYEDLDIKNGTAKILLDKIERGMNVHPRAQDAKKDEVLLTIGQKISAAEVALLASVGKSNVKVFSFPKTAVISSGDELVDITVTPEPHQIRRSNTYALQAAMKELHWESDTFHLVDRKEEIMSSLRKILNEHDVLILSGGVSKGKFDFIPEVLEQLGVQKRFHQVSQRRENPFGLVQHRITKRLYLPLPGNPVSTFLCFYKYIKPWILACNSVDSKPQSAVLALDVNFSPSLTYFLQVRTESQNGKLMAYPHVGGGSGDFANLKSVDGFFRIAIREVNF
jgi:molybdopterin molybdotransferase